MSTPALAVLLVVAVAVLSLVGVLLGTVLADWVARGRGER